jgi:predicted negative regulator of RcsB-dependent stress response
MQTQDTSADFLFKIWPWLEANKNRLIGAVVAIIVLSGILYFISSQKAQKEIDAGQALTSVIMNPVANANPGQLAGEFQQLAEKYAGTVAGQRAQLQAATALFGAGNYAEAQVQFQKFLSANPTGPLAATAQIGVATSLEAQNKLDEAAAAYQRVVSVFPDSPSVPTAQLGLGRIAEQQNKINEALNHYEEVARSPFGGSLANEAMVRGTELKAKMAATSKPAGATPTAPKPAATPTVTPMTVPQPATKH